jgi:hypothetical protein
MADPSTPFQRPTAKGGGQAAPHERFWIRRTEVLPYDTYP